MPRGVARGVPWHPATMMAAEETQLVMQLLPRVRRMARGFRRSLPASIHADDLAHAGVVGLLGALRTYDRSRGEHLEAYALQRARGAILDELRAADPLTRAQRRAVRTVRRATTTLEKQLGRSVGVDEIATATGMTSDRVDEARRLAAVTAASPTTTPDVAVHSDTIERIAHAQLRPRLTAAIALLPARSQQVLSLYYEASISLRAIGTLLGLSESRVCQIHSAAVRQLRGAIEA